MTNNPRTYNFHDLEVGQSIICEGKPIRIRPALRSHAELYDKKFTTEKTENKNQLKITRVL